MRVAAPEIFGRCRSAHTCGQWNGPYGEIRNRDGGYTCGQGSKGRQCSVGAVQTRYWRETIGAIEVRYGYGGEGISEKSPVIRICADSVACANHGLGERSPGNAQARHELSGTNLHAVIERHAIVPANEDVHG